MKVELFVPCVIDQFFPEVAVNTMKVLRRAGVDVDYKKAHNYFVKAAKAQNADVVYYLPKSNTPKSFNYLRKLKSPLDDKNTKAGSIELINKDRSLGFENSCVICAFPHMIPDNCIDLSSVLFEDILIKSNDKTNKPLDDYIERRKNQVYCF